MTTKIQEWFVSWKSRAKTVKDDAIAGLIVAIVALPLALGFAIASNVDPAMGVYTAIVAGFFAALCGGSEYQISGPTGAMVVVILSVVSKYGVGGLVLATLIAGIILILLGALKLGKIIEYIPSPVIVGFTAGIAFLIFFGQVNNFFGIKPTYPADASFFTKTVISLSHALGANIGAVILAIVTLLILIVMPRITRRIPGSIVAVIVATTLAAVFTGFFHVMTVSDIGKIPQGLPVPHLPSISWSLVVFILPAALTIAALAAIESLLSAVVADQLTDTRHNPNQELIGQGIANIASGLFGGMPGTGAIARTATNIRNGGKSRLVGIFHAIFLLVIVLSIGALAALIPLAALAGILMYVAFNMVEWERIRLIFRTPLSDVAVMLTTFLLTIFVDLTVAIEVGLVLAALLFMKRMSDLYNVETYTGLTVSEKRTRNVGRTAAQNKIDNSIKDFAHPDISIYTISGPLFFGAASRFDQMVAETPGGHKPIKIIRMKHVPVIDATGLNFLEGTFHKHRKRGGIVLFSTVRPDVMRIIRKSGLEKTLGAEHFFPTTKDALLHALKHAHRMHGEPQSVTPEEMAKYDLSTLDFQDRARSPSSRDHDPVEEAFEHMGVTKMQRAGEKGVSVMRKAGREGGKTILKTIDATLQGTEKTISKTRAKISRSPLLEQRKKKR